MKNKIFLRNLGIIVYPIIFMVLYYKSSFIQEILNKLLELCNDKANAIIIFMLIFIFVPELIILLISKYIWETND